MAMDMRGSLNVSKYQKTPEQPRFYGRALINGKEYKLKGWEKDGKNGPWISLLFEDDEEFEQKVEVEKPSLFSKPLPSTPVKVYINQDDDIPF